MKYQPKVMKFGGAVLKDIDGFRAMLDILKQNNGEKIVLVISAFGKSTTILKNSALKAENGDYEAALAEAKICLQTYENIAEKVLVHSQSKSGADVVLEKVRTKLSNLLKGVSITRELTPRTLDAITACGEEAALVATTLFLKDSNLSAESITGGELITTDSNFGRAIPDIDASAERIERIISEIFSTADIAVTQGFVAKDRKGEITTMGLESSNLSAAIIARSLNVAELEIFTDVAGIRSADPKTHSDTVLFAQMDYLSAYTAGMNGLKLIFPSMISLAQESKFNIKISSAFAPLLGESTLISGQPAEIDEILQIERPNLYFYQNPKIAFSNDDKILRVENAGTEYVISTRKTDNYTEVTGNIYLAFSERGRQKLHELSLDRANSVFSFAQNSCVAEFIRRTS